MLSLFVYIVTIFGTLVWASTETSYSFTTAGKCSTTWGSGGTVPMSLPTSTTISTVYSLLTNDVVTVPSTSTITADAVTTTVLEQTSWTWSESTITIPTTTRWVGAQSTVATASWPTTICTNDVTPTTVTEYSGSYIPVPGQVTTEPASYPSQVVCRTGVTWFTYLLPTTTSGETTVTVTPTSTVFAPTTTLTSTAPYYTFTRYETTITSVTTTYRVATSVVTSSIACEATTTTTFAAKCEPTNVIKGIGEFGIVSGKYAKNITVTYVPDEKYYDPGVCCQLCQDNDGCVGMMAGTSGYCALYYVGAPNGGPACDFGFSYQTEASRFPGQGLWVQSGCGEIEFMG
ncbi:putative ca2+-modulated nonselective cation channel polycystin protein [Daldinia childiae]|uniref:putative ca2+-modulated nonselective cation channel polycystin protein n=1 Tax=Daldinia childiae TaxID=326645 RepID=UPI001444DA9F|nr:putative ca2+-modulated nonselective cation channel polycystin protein [Daldinia childiae]KAF3066412.1 putative ca2+-modulated nonselective cation channel polycystin protein [Daldinia childiae]